MNRINVRVEIDPQYNRKTNPNKKGVYPVHIVLRKVRKKASIIPNLPPVALDGFQKAPGSWVKKSIPNYKSLNLILSEIVNSIEKFLIENHTKEFSPNEVKAWYEKNHTHNGKFSDHKEKLFIEYAENYCDKIRNPATQVNYRQAVNKLKEFYPGLRFFEVNRPLIISFANYLENKAGLAGKSCRVFLDHIKTIYIEWYKESLPEDPNGYQRYFSGISFNQKPVKEKKYLNSKQLKDIWELKLDPDSIHEKVRDIFLFMCFTSRSYKELKDLSFEKNVVFENGDPEKPIIIGQRTKSGKVPFANLIVNEAHRAIFKKYHPIASGVLFPQLELAQSNPSYDLSRYLEKIGKLAKIDFRLSGRTARYTFINEVSKNINPKLRADMIGHANTQTQLIYNAENFSLYHRSGALFEEL